MSTDAKNRDRSLSGALLGALFNLCPYCREGKIFASFLKMNAKCPSCGLVFEREPGYFLGAMSISYSMGFVGILPVFLILLFKDVSLAWTVGVPAVQIVLMSPFMFRISRLIYIHMDRRTDT
ncbi:MAG: DUF983 domain-containing protein [Deltaproteobacteria bacterium]|nr:DUF983 domain-containing protein [Deltaproteobacteria bacterium]